MTTKLDRLLESIDPSRTIDELFADADRALNSFPVPQATIESWEEYKDFFADFFRHLDTVILHMRPGGPDDRAFWWGRCFHILKKAYGESGYKTAFEMVRTGKEGGLYRVLKTVARVAAEEYSQNGISARVSHYLNGLSLDELFAAHDEYINKYGYLLPSELTEDNGALLRLHFTRVLKEHPKMIQRMRRIGKKL